MGTRVSDIWSAVHSALVESRYGGKTIAQYRYLFGQLERLAPNGVYTEEVGAAFAAETSGPRSAYLSHDKMCCKERIVRLADEYVATGSFDLGRVRGRNPPPMPESAEMRRVLDLYADDNMERGLARDTRDGYWRLAREFALHLEAEGVASFADAPASSVLSFVSGLLSGRWSGTTQHHLAGYFRPFLRFLGREDMVLALTISRQPRERSILPVLSDADEEALARACMEGRVSTRDAAVTLLALTTGMRSRDIRELELSDIDWRSSTISTVQSKTGNPLTVPMAPAVAEAIARYVLEERPPSPHPNVFLSARAPFGPLSDHSAIYEITGGAFEAAGLVGGGTRLLRHNAASRMVRAGTDLPVVSAVLGHADPDSSGSYIESDDARMLSCVLPLPGAVAR